MRGRVVSGVVETRGISVEMSNERMDGERCSRLRSGVGGSGM